MAKTANHAAKADVEPVEQDPVVESQIVTGSGTPAGPAPLAPYPLAGSLTAPHTKSLTFPRVVAGSEEALLRAGDPTPTVETLPTTPSASHRVRTNLANEEAGYTNLTQHTRASGKAFEDPTVPVAHDPVTATGATAGTPGTFTPLNATAPANLTAMTGITASPATAWTTGQHVVLRDNSLTHWSGTGWIAGAKP